MNRLVLGAVAALFMVGIGLFWWQGRAAVENAAPPPSPEALASATPAGLPTADPAGLVGPAPPEATELTKEQQRFFRYDANRDWRISREEMLATRTEAFRALDADGNNLLTFEEWAVATSQRFAGMDRDRNAELTPAEFALSRPKPVPKPKCSC